MRQIFATLNGVTQVETAADRHTLRLTMQGAADVVIKAGAEHSVVTLTSHEPSLEDISMRYYEGVSSAL